MKDSELGLLGGRTGIAEELGVQELAFWWFISVLRLVECTKLSILGFIFALDVEQCNVFNCCEVHLPLFAVLARTCLFARYCCEP